MVDNFKIEVVARDNSIATDSQLFFINLGGYKENEFEEYHYKVLAVGNSMAEASRKQNLMLFQTFYFQGATSHIDDKYGIDVDDIFNVKKFFRLPLQNNLN